MSMQGIGAGGQVATGAGTSVLSERFIGYDDLQAVALGGAPLTVGASSAGIDAVQSTLKALGFDIGSSSSDGDFGPGTQRALVQFQASAGLPQTGALDGATLLAIDARCAGQAPGSTAASAPARAPSRAPVPPSGGGSSSVAPSRAVLGKIDPDTAEATGDIQRSHDSDTPNVSVGRLPPVEVKPGVQASPIVYRSSMMTDTDGSGDAHLSDKTGQAHLPLKDAQGQACDPTKTRYVSVPLGFADEHGLAYGDIFAVVYGGKVTYAQLGDAGGQTLGEASIATERALGLQHGVDHAEVTYVGFPGSGDGRQALAPDELARRGAALFAAAGGVP
jgi:peptidoglycan hydrolase-like protein with peptidoglycan-binding domain